MHDMAEKEERIAALQRQVSELKRELRTMRTAQVEGRLRSARPSDAPSRALVEASSRFECKHCLELLNRNEFFEHVQQRDCAIGQRFAVPGDEALLFPTAPKGAVSNRYRSEVSPPEATNKTVMVEQNRSHLEDDSGTPGGKRSNSFYSGAGRSQFSSRPGRGAGLTLGSERSAEVEESVDAKGME